ncbi:MAG TPA: endolytic transglycosylase MltG [Vitreimonas sp.]|nr:endolytic transglycosylase MltG [Vitreimonas sp.]
MSFLLKTFFIGALLAILVLAGVTGYAYTQLQPASSTPTDSTTFVIPKGQAISIIGHRLAEEGLIKNPLAFRAYVKFKGLGDKLQAGSFKLNSGMSLGEIAQQLTTGTDDLWITIPEGWRVEEIADSLDRQELGSFDKDEFLELADVSEGKLYPDTYLVSRDSTAATIYNLLTNTFEQKVVEGLADEIEASGHTLEEAIIMASIIERESSGEEDMAVVSGILWNRFEIGMPLQADATLQYVKGYDKTQQSWWVPPLAVDKELNSPFNTYKNPGLPPRPIASPGAAAIKAALDPAQTNDLFYIHDRQGQIHTARTLDEHNANVQKYLR